MGAVSQLEDIIDQAIGGLNRLSEQLDACSASIDVSEARAHAIREARETVLAHLQHAKQLAASSGPTEPLQLDGLLIENGRLKRDAERTNSEISRLKQTLSEFVSQLEAALARQRIDAEPQRPRRRRRRRRVKGELSSRQVPEIDSSGGSLE